MTKWALALSLLSASALSATSVSAPCGESGITGTCSLSADSRLTGSYTLTISQGLNETGWPIAVQPSTFAGETSLYTVLAQLSIQSASGLPIDGGLGWAGSSLAIDLNLPATSGNWSVYGVIEGGYPHGNGAVLDSMDEFFQDSPRSFLIPHQSGDPLPVDISLTASIDQLRTTQEATLILVFGDPPASDPAPEPRTVALLSLGLVALVGGKVRARKVQRDRGLN